MSEALLNRINNLTAENEVLRAALAKKEREAAEAREDETAALKAGKMLYDDLTAKLAAAQEEAKGLRTALDKIITEGKRDPDRAGELLHIALAGREASK